MSTNKINPLNLDIEFKNLGKVKKANIKIRPFTVIAGCNASGKSFITKTLYSLLLACQETDYQKQLKTVFDNIVSDLESLIKNTEEKNIHLNKIRSDCSKLSDINILDMRSLKSQDIVDILNSITLNINQIDFFKDKNAKQQLSIFDNLYLLLRPELKTDIISSIDEAIMYINFPDKKLIKYYENLLSDLASDNFMILSVGEIIRYRAKAATIKLTKIGTIDIESSSVRVSSEFLKNIKNFQIASIVYLESPVYWKLTSALEDSRNYLESQEKRRNLKKRSFVSKTPKYIFDILKLLNLKIKESPFEDIVEYLEDVILGSLNYNDGEITFNDKNQKTGISLSLAASGSTNLGMLALLLKRGAILPGSVLFIDEPEVHLHPAWQVILVKTLYELSKRGVTVIIASHSIDIMKAIEMLMDSDDDIDQSQHFGINQLTADGMSVDDSDNNFKRLAAIKEDLGKPFYDMFIEEGL